MEEERHGTCKAKRPGVRHSEIASTPQLVYDDPHDKPVFRSNSGQDKEGDLSLRLAQLIVQPSLLVTHGEGIFRLILVSQATFGAITAFWWHMHYFETQDEKNGWSSKFKNAVSHEGLIKIMGRGNRDTKATVETRITGAN